MRDLKLALRSLSRRPGLTLVVVLTAGLGIGASTAVFDLLNLVLWRPLPGTHDGRLVRVHSESPHPFIGPWGYLPYLDYLDFAEHARSFQGLAGEHSESVRLATVEVDLPGLSAQLVSGNLFDLLGLRAAHGRLLEPSDDRRSAEPVLVLGHRLWQRHFEGDAGVVGRPVRVNGHPFYVVGVAPPELRGTTAGTTTDLWLPLSRGIEISLDWQEDPVRQNTAVLGQLRAGVGPSQAQAELQNLAAALDTIRPLPELRRRISVIPARLTHAIDRTNLRPTLLLLMTAVGLLLLLACANVANLLLVRALGRRKEMGIRRSLGAGRSRLVRQLLTESLLLAFLAGLWGLLLALWGRRLWRLYELEDFAREMTFDHRVLSLSLAISVAAAILFGMAPALLSARTDLVSALKEGGDLAGRRRLSSFQVLSALQVALSAVLLVSTSAVVLGLWSLHRADLGFDDRGLLRMGVELEPLGYSRQEGSALMQRVAERVAHLPGIESVGLCQFLPPLFLDVELRFRLAEVPDEVRASRFNTVDSGYFTTLGIALLSGRLFGERDRTPERGVAVVNRMLAEQLWPRQEALGRRLLIERRLPGDPGPEYEVIGVVESITQHDLRRSAEPILYLFSSQRPRSFFSLVARARGDLAPVAGLLRAEAAALEPRLATPRVVSAREVRWDALVVERLHAASVGLMAVVGLGLALIGIFGVMSHAVASRAREIGIRIAVGASGSQVLGRVLRQGAALTLAGVALGLIAAWWGTRFLRSLLGEVAAPGLWVYFAVAAALLVAGLAATYLPARRASKVEPTQVLRSE